MSFYASRLCLLTAFAVLSVPALADDCAAAKAAMYSTAHKPASTTTTKTDSQGKQSVTRTVQTETNKYVQIATGEWYSMNISMKDLTDNLKTAKLTCRRSGGDVVNGEPAAVYEVRIDNDGIVSDIRIWVSAKTLILKSDTSADGTRYSTVYDFSHVTPPANAKRMGGN